MPSTTLHQTQIERSQQRARETLTLFSLDIVQTLSTDVQALIDLAQQRVVTSGL